MQTKTHHEKSLKVAYVMNPLNMRLIRKQKQKQKGN